MNSNLLPTDRVGLLEAIDPDAHGTGTVSTGWVDATDFATFAAIIMAGTLGASATVDAKIEQAQDAAGTGAKDIANKAITQLTQAGGDDFKQDIINVRADDLDMNNDYTHIRLSVIIGTAACDLAGSLFGLDPRYGSASDNDNESVNEIIH